MTRRVVTNISMVATVMKTQAIIVTIFSLNFALTDIQMDMIILRNTTTVDAPTLAASDADSSAFRTETGTRNALPAHWMHIKPNRENALQFD